MMDKQSFFNLIDKYQDGTASAAEQALVEEYYRRLEVMGKTELTVEEELALKETMYRKIMSGVAGSRPNSIPLYRRIYRRIAAAAAILILVSAGSYFLFFHKPGSQSISPTATNKSIDLPPGRDAAILTMADGRQIILDSTSGTISKENGITVINLNGKLSYQQVGMKDQPVEYNTVTTARGNQYQLVLADGSKVWLNSASSLRFPTAFTGNDRQVQMTGEGYFEVAKDPIKKFIVESNGTATEVLGTHFNINAYADEGGTKVTLLEGSVILRQASTNQVRDRKDDKGVLLKPGQQAQAGSSINVVNADITQVMAWKNGWFEFERTDLATIMRQISRWYDLDIVYEGTPGHVTFGGRISKELPLSKVLGSLEANGNGIKFRLEGKKLIVQP